MTTATVHAPSAPEIADALIAEVADASGKAPDEFTVDSTISGLQIDRVQLQDILFDVERKLGVSLGVPERKALGNIDQTISSLASRIQTVLEHS